MTVRIDRVVTKGGDGGQTSLGDGSRVSKDSLRVCAYGTVDEANATLGMLRLQLGAFAEIDAMLARAQNDLFDLGADLCVPGEAGARLRVGDGIAARYEAQAAELNAGLAPLESFVLPAGSPAAVHAHLARTVVRRAEREVVALSHVEAVNGEVIRALNRLSDLLFIVARVVNAGQEQLWRAGGG